jgi:hypothetical protein
LRRHFDQLGADFLDAIAEEGLVTVPNSGP